MAAFTGPLTLELSETKGTEIWVFLNTKSFYGYVYVMVEDVIQKPGH